MQGNKQLRVVIVGGVAGGASVAARLRRLDEFAHITLLEKGEYISFANCGLPYYIGGTIIDRKKLLLQTVSQMNTRFNLDIHNFTEVTKINREKKQVEAFNIRTQQKLIYQYDKLVISPGGEPIRPPLPGIDSQKIFTLRNVPDSDHIKNFIFKNNPKHCVVIGAGFIGLEMAENLVHKGIMVTIVEALDQVMGPLDFEMAALVHQHLKLHEVQLFLKDGVKEFDDQGNKIVLTLNSGKKVDADFVVLSIGVRPDTKIAKEAGLECGRGIIVNERLETSDPDIYALGDAVEVKDIVSGDMAVFPLAGPANKQGRLVADQLAGRKESIFRGAQGTGIAKVFDITVATTGLNVKMCQFKKIPYLECVTHNDSHAGYYPGSYSMAIKLVFSPDTGRLLGAQAVGVDGIDKRIDILAVAVRKQMTVYDLEELELAYAPPFGSAKDAVNQAGFVAVNMLKKDVNVIRWNQVDEKVKDEGAILVDVRYREEYLTATIPGAINYPLDELRNSYQSIPLDKPLIIFCQQGLRGYVATRFLQQIGFKTVYNLAGGFKTWNYAYLKQSNENIFENAKKIRDDDFDYELAINSNNAFWVKGFEQLNPEKKVNAHRNYLPKL